MKLRAFSILLATTFLAACQTAQPQIRVNSTPDFPEVPRLVSSTCATSGLLDGEGQRPFFRDVGELGGIAGILASAFIGQGVDLLGSKLKAAGEEQKLSFDALLNVTSASDYANKKCFDLSREGIRVQFAMIPTQDTKHVSYRVTSLAYPETLDGEDSGVRGLALTIEIHKPGIEKPVSQTIPLYNVEVGADAQFDAKEGLFSSAFVSNPFVRPETDAELKPRLEQDASATRKLLRDLPFTLTARLTEVRDANEFYQFGAGVIEESNDDLTAALIRAFGIDTGSDDSSSEEGGGSGGDTPEVRPTGDPTEGS